MTIVKKVILYSLFLVLLSSVFLIGGFIGFNNGYAYRSFGASTTDAYITLRTIEEISSRKPAAVKADLEQQLDTQIVEHWAGLVNKPLNIGMVPQDDEVVKNLMSKVAAYRKRHPSKTTDPDIKNAIETVVARYDDGSVPVRPKRTRR